ncbi:hypothetical protein [Jiangella alkaliphila]|uniref:hypothetical protein n=1 Tax=Jiangella alkaliphila TaxID=419479 RepID=UPI0012F79ED6|nr:hypothetical protein [Jiangella alkaliphila]
MLKPSIKSAVWNRNAAAKALPAAGPEQLLAVYDRVATWSEALVAQQYIDGDDDQL